MLSKIRDNMDQERLKKTYAKIYGKGGFGYNKENGYKILDIIQGQGTLLDVGCGDGFWSNILSEKFKVTGIDISEVGIRNAKKSYADIEFLLRDFLTCTFNKKYDVVFMRSPSFMNFKTESRQFRVGIEKAIEAGSNIWYIKYSQPPYDRYLQGSYIHDPEKVEKVFSEYGKTNIIIKDTYFYANLLV